MQVGIQGEAREPFCPLPPRFDETSPFADVSILTLPEDRVRHTGEEQ
jgi:hypothetical protein